MATMEQRPVEDKISDACILIVEDDTDWTYLVRHMLTEATTMKLEVRVVGRLSDVGPELANKDVDCILLDLSLPDANGLEALLLIHGMAPKVPVVVLSGTKDEFLALRAVRSGAQDYILKDDAKPVVLDRAIHYAIERQLNPALRANGSSPTGSGDTTSDDQWYLLGDTQRSAIWLGGCGALSGIMVASVAAGVIVMMFMLTGLVAHRGFLRL